MMDIKWNNRVIRTEDGTLFFAEVSYVNGVPSGYTSPCLVGDTPEGLREVLNMLTAAIDKPVLDMEVFE
jgi:hypothetical protein